MAACAQAALELDIEDINAYCQRQDALNLLKRMPRRKALPVITGPEQTGNHASSHTNAGATVA